MKKRKNNPNLVVYHPRRPIHPNAADPGYFTRKILDVVTGIVSGIGLITAMVVLITFA